MPRLLAPRVPARLAFISARTASWPRCGLTSAPNTAPSGVTCFEDLPVLSSKGALMLAMRPLLPHLDDGVLRAGNSALDQQQAVLRVDVVDDEPDLGHALAAEPPGHFDALEDPRRSRRCAHRARLADVVRTVRLRAAVELVALDRPCETLAGRGGRDLGRLGGLGGPHGRGLARGQRRAAPG